jgi:hypothetical protein
MVHELGVKGPLASYYDTCEMVSQFPTDFVWYTGSTGEILTFQKNLSP